MHELLVNRLGGLSLPRKSVIRLTDSPNMTLDVYRGSCKTKTQQQQLIPFYFAAAYKMDRLASGVYVIPKGFQATKKLEKEIDEDKLEKEYVCRVVGKFPE